MKKLVFLLLAVILLTACSNDKIDNKGAAAMMNITAEEAIEIVENNLLKGKVENSKTYTRKQLADYLELTIDTLRNWELNGLLRIKRKENGYRVYNEDDIKRIKIIRSLRCVNFSLSAILRLLRNLDNDL